MFESKLSCEFILYWIIVRLAPIVIDLGSVENRVMFDGSKGMGVVATARVIR
jgi:hypothetical protein